MNEASGQSMDCNYTLIILTAFFLHSPFSIHKFYAFMNEK